MTQDPLDRAIAAAGEPIRASMAPWGVLSCRWLGEVDGAPTLEVRTRTELERVALQAQPWMSAQVEVILARLAVPRHVAQRLQLRFVSDEADPATD